MKEINLFLDTEFTGLYQNTELISLALIAETGEEFYAELNDFNKQKAIQNPWVEAHVLGSLFLTDSQLQSRSLKNMYILENKQGVKTGLEIWLAQFGVKKDNFNKIIPHIRIWADVPVYDWILFSELFGGAKKIPPSLYNIPGDLATLLFTKGFSFDIPREKLLKESELPSGVKHNALYDARLGMKIFKKLR